MRLRQIGKELEKIDQKAAPNNSSKWFVLW
jgi:hypothetical protein